MSPSILTIDGWADRIAAAPDDAELRGVFEDWLRERGHDAVVDWLHHHELENLGKLDDAGRAAFIALAEQVDVAIQARLARVPVENCRVSGCRATWAGLERGRDPRERFCKDCGEPVHWATSRQDIVRLDGRPVALAPAVRCTPRTPVSVERNPGAFARPPDLDVLIAPGSSAPEPLGPPVGPRLTPPSEPLQPPASARRPWWSRIFGGD